MTRTTPPAHASRWTGGLVPAIALAGLAAARIAAGFVPAMAAWGLNVQRFAPPAWSVVLVALPAVALLPAVARPVTSWLDRRRFGRRSWRIGFALAATLLVAMLPDRVWFTGDFIGRQFSLNAEGPGLAWYTHAMPLDGVIHEWIGRLIVRAAGVTPNAFGRLVGGVESGTLAWIATGLALELGLTGAAAIATASLVFWGGWLALFTGYNKALSDMTLAVALFGLLGLRLTRRGGGLLALGSLLGVALLIHRSSLALLPAFAVAWIVASKRPAAHAPGARQRIAALVIPAIVLAAITPHLVAMVRQYDLALLVPLAAHTAADTRALDLLNALLFLAPVAVVFLPLGLAVEPRAWWSAEGAFFAALVVPFLAIAAWFYPPEGLFRYWDILAPTGIALSLTGAWTAARIVAASNRWRWLWVSCSIAAACPALLIMVHDANTESGLKRVQAFLDEPPARSPQMRASAWEFMGFRLIDLGRAAEAAEAFAHAADVVPSPRVLRQWAVAETMAGDPVAAQSVLRRIVDRDPGNRSAWQALAAQSIQNGDSTESVRALKALIRLSPGDPEPRNALRRIAPDRAGRPH